jgi:hypothetical protein
MNIITVNTLKVLSKVYAKVFRVQTLPKPICHQDPDNISKIIYEKLMDDQPCMIARFGSTELNMLVNYKGVKEQNKNIWTYITKPNLPWWWEKSRMQQMEKWSGFFPPTKKKILQFCKLMENDIQEIDILGSWLTNETYFDSEMSKVNKVRLVFIDPFWTKKPWTKALEHKKVLIVHPFAKLIEEQYKKREVLFTDKNVLPEFQLKTIKAVQSIGGDDNGFSDWFEAFDSMKRQIDEMDYDICLLGCGAYGLPLAAHVKRQGKKSVHWGGSLQLFFGIIGKRWEDNNYAEGVRHINPDVIYPNLINEHWIRPSEMKTKHSQNVESGCYW